MFAAFAVFSVARDFEGDKLSPLPPSSSRLPSRFPPMPHLLLHLRLVRGLKNSTAGNTTFH